MRVAFVAGPGRLEIRDGPAPEPSANGVIVAVGACGICGTDVHAFVAGHRQSPAVFGHEWSGTIVALGRDVVGLAEGDRVVVAVPPPCGRCGPCRAGHADTCELVHAVARGRDVDAPANGGFADHIAVDAGRVTAVDPRLDDIEATLVEPTTIVVHAVRRMPPGHGALAVILGAGPIGLLAAQVVRTAGAATVAVVEPDPARRQVALTVGADAAVSAAEAASAIADLSNGLGADVVYECAGRPDTIQSAVDLARRGGAVCLVGLAPGPATISPREWLLKEITVAASLAYVHDDFAAAMALLADGRVQAAPIVTGTVGLDGLGAALAQLADGGSGHLKLLVDPNR